MPEGVDYASSNVIAGTGLELNYVQDRVYAYSGTFPAATSDQTMLEFMTGSKTIKGLFECMGTFNPNASGNIGDGKNTAFQIYLNGVVVSSIKIGSIGESMPTKERQEIIIPPYTNVKLTVLSSGASGTELSTATFVGKSL